MRAYCDDRAAALALAAALQHENDLLRAENDRLRDLVHPGPARWRGAFAQASSALTVTIMLLGAMVGAGLIVDQTAASAEANVTREVGLDARLAVVSPHEVVGEVPSPSVVVVAPAAILPVQVIAPDQHRHHGHARHRRHHHHHHRDRL